MANKYRGNVQISAATQERLNKMKGGAGTSGASVGGTGATKAAGTSGTAPTATGTTTKYRGNVQISTATQERLNRMKESQTQSLLQGPTASGLAGQGASSVPGLELPSIDSYMPESVGSSNRSFMYRALDNASALEGKTPVSVRLASAQSSYDKVTKELEEARAAQRQADEDMGWAMFRSGTTFDPALATASNASESAAQQVRDLEKQQSQYANQLYTYRNERDAARLRTDTGSIGAKYSALRDADDELNRLQTALHNWDVSPYTPEEQQAMAQRVKELTAQVDRQKREFDAEAKAAGYVTTYDRLREYEKNQREKATADEIVRQAGESANTPGGAWAMSALSVLGKPWETVETAAGMLGSIGHNDPGNLDTYRPLDTGRFTMSRVGEMTRGTVGGNLAEAFPLEIGGQNVAQMLYDTGMSIADSAYLAATLGAAGSAVGGAKAGANLVGGAMFGSAAANQMQSVAERGGTNNQILMGGIAAGTAEVLFESFSIEKLLAEKSVTGWKSWVKETLKQMGVEASEEMATEVANILTDTAIMGDSSDFSQNVAQYQAAGMTKEDAQHQAFLDAMGQVAVAGVGGALSGGIMGGVNNARMGGRNNRILNNASKGILPDAETRAALSESEAGRDILTQAQERYEQFQRGVQGAQEGQEGPPVPGVVPAQEEGETAPLPSQAGNQRHNQTAEERTAALLADADRGVMPDSQTIEELNATPEGQATLLEITRRYGRYHSGANQAAQNETAAQGAAASENTAFVQTIRRAIPEIQDMDPVAEVTGTEIPAGTRVVDRLVGFINSIGNKVNRAGFGDVLFSKGRVKNSMIGHGMGNAKIEVFAAVPDVIRSGRQVDYQENWKGRGYDSYTFAAPVTYRGGRTYLGVIVTKDARDGRYYLHEAVDANGSVIYQNKETTGDTSDGRASQEGAFDTVVNPVDESSVPRSGGNVNTGRPAPGVRDLRSAGGELRLASLMGDEDVAFLDRLGKAAGVRINVVDADNRANGWYQDGQVYITANAAREGENSLVRQVALHEITHYMKDAAPEEYRRYTRKVAELLGEDLESGKQKYKARYADGGVELSDEGALDEVAAHFTENLMEDEGLFRRLAVEDRTLAQRVLDALRRFIERIKGAFTGRQTGQMEQIAEAWADALDRAGANARQGGLEYSEGRQYSIEETQDGDQITVINEGQEAFDGQPRNRWPAIARRVLLDKYKGQTLPLGREDLARFAGRQAGEYAYPRARYSENSPEFEAKMRAAPELEHLLETAEYSHWAEDTKQHPEATLGFDYYKVRFIVGGHIFEGLANIANSENGRILYDITKIKEIPDTSGKYATLVARSTSAFGDLSNEASPFNQGQSVQTGFSGGNTSSVNSILQRILDVKRENERNITQDIRSSYGDEPQTTFLRDASMDSVAQSGGNVNPRRELTFQEEVQRQLTGEDPRDAEAPNPSPAPASSASPDGLTPSPKGKALSGAGIESGEGTEGENRRAYSLQITEGLGRELYELRRQNQRLEDAQAKSANVPDMTDMEARTEARRLLTEFGSKANLEETAGLLQALYHHMSETGAKPNDSTVREVAETIARNILDSASETDDAMWRDYEGLRKFLKDTKIKVPRDTWGGLDAVGGYNEFRRQYFGRLNLSSTEGRGIDDVYNELSGEYPGLFDEDAHPNPEDQIVQIAEVLDAIRPETFNPYAGDSAGAADWLAGEIMERFYDRRTDRRVSEAVKNERQRGLERQKRRLKQVRDQRDQKIKDIKEKNRQAARKARERQNTAQVRDRVYRHAKALSRKLLNPRDDFRVPEKLRAYTLALLDDLDLGSGYGIEVTPEGKFKRVSLVDENGKPIERADLKPTDRTVAALQLKAALEELAKDEERDISVDPDLADKLNEIAEMKGVPVGGMTRDQAETVWETIKALESAISNADKTLGQSKYKKLSDMAEAIRAENGSRKDRRNFAEGILDDADKLLNLDMLTPETYFHRLGKAGDDIYEQARKAQDRQIAITQEGVKFFHSAMKETGLTEEDLQRAERENHDFTVGGQEIAVSTAQLMDLYALFKRKQAQDHITIGGLYFEGGRKGLYKTGQSVPVHVTIEDLSNMLNTLTPAQRGFVDRLQKFMSTTLAGYGNEATEEVYGYWKFKEENYWPIKVHNTQLKTDEANEAKAKTIPSFGMTRATTPNADNAVTVRSFLDSYTEHLNQMATYAGWLATSENITRLHNFKFTLDGKRTGETVKTLFKKVYGEGGDAYLKNLLQDIAQGTRTGDSAGFTSKLFRNFKVTAVAGNFRVILQQPTAILRAAEVINPVYMAAPGNPLKAFEEAKQWAPIAQWKDWGYFEMGTGRSLRELMVGTEGAMDKFRDFAGKGAGFADNVGWGILWNAVKAETRAEHKELKAGSDAFYQRCAKRFGEIIDRTQVVDSVLHRTQIMRSGDGLKQMATSFMSEPSKIYNMVARDVYDITHAEKGSPERRRAIRHVARTGIALSASYIVNAAAQAVMDAIRDDDRDKDYGEKFLEAYTGLDGTEKTAKDVITHLLGGNLGQNYLVFGYLPYVKDIQSIIQGFDVSRADMDGVSKFVAAAQSLEKALAGSGKKTVLNAGLETAMKGLGLLGLPVDRLKRDLVGLGNTLLLGFGQNEAVYEMDKLMLDVGNANNASVFYDTLYRAMDGDWMQYQHIYGDMLENGFDPDKINTAMNKRMAEAAGLTKVKHLPMEWTPPGEDADFDAMIQADGSWLDRTDEDALELARTLDGAELEGDTDSEKNRSAMRMIADQPFGEDVKEMAMEGVMSESAYAKYMAARDAGVSTYDYVDFLEAARVANLARGMRGSDFSMDDVTKALEGSRLSAAQKRAIWDAQGWKKESPWG